MPAQRIEATGQMAMDKNPANATAFKVMLKDPDQLVRRHAIFGLERLGDPASAKDIVPLLKDQEPWVRRNAAIALGKLHAREATGPLVAVLTSDDIELRHEAFVALGRIGDPATQKPILKALRDKRLWTELTMWDQVDILSLTSHDFITDPETHEVLKWMLTYKDWDHPEFAALPPEQKDGICVQMAVCAASTLIEKYHDPSGEKFLLEGLANVNDDYMQQGTAQLLGRLKCKAAIPLLVKQLDSEWTLNKRTAIIALGEIGENDPAAREALLKALEHPVVALRPLAAAALTKMHVEHKAPDLSDPPAVPPATLAADLQVPGGKRPPQFICLGVDDCVNMDGLEAMLDICETLKANGSKAVFTMWVAPLMASPESRDLDKQTLLLRRLYDMGCEIANHTLRHNPDGKYWTSVPKEQQIEALEGCAQWFRDHFPGYTRPFAFKGGGGATSTGVVDRKFSDELLARQNFVYSTTRGPAGRRNDPNRLPDHPNTQVWPGAKPNSTTPGRPPYIFNQGCFDAAAPPVHARIADPIYSDYGGRFDYEVPAGVAMWKANFEYRYNLPQRPILAVNGFHDWGLKSLGDPTAKGSHRNEGNILKAFLLDVLVQNKDKYPDAYCVTFRQVVEYAATDGDLKHTLAVGNCQDSRNPVKPVVP
jgi:HEAT repeat protein